MSEYQLTTMNNSTTSLMDLPLEMIQYICQYLDLDDIKSVRHSSEFLNRSVARIFASKSCMHLEDIYFPLGTFKKILSLETTKTKNMKFTDMHLADKTMKLMKLLTSKNYVEHLKFVNCRIDGPVLYDFMNSFPHLKELHIENHKNKFSYVKLILAIAKKVEKLTLLRIAEDVSQVIIEAKFRGRSEYKLRWVKIDLPVFRVHINYLERFFMLITKNMVELSMIFDNFTENFMDWFTRMKINTLEELTVSVTNGKDRLNVTEFIRLVIGQEMVSKRIPKPEECKCTQLRSINFSYEHAYETYLEPGNVPIRTYESTFFDFNNLSYFEELNLKLRCQLNKIIFPRNSNTKMKNISLNCIISHDVLRTIALCCTNLQVLNLSMKFKPFPRNIMRLIFFHLSNLDELSLEARGTTNDDPEYYQTVNISRLKKLKRVKFINLKYCPELSLQYLVNAKQLEYVDYRNTQTLEKPTDTEISDFLLSCYFVEQLNFRGMYVTREYLKMLRACQLNN